LTIYDFIKGLQLELNVSDSILTYKSGFRILINNQSHDLYAFPEDDGIRFLKNK